MRFIFFVCFFSFNTFADFDWQGHRGARGLYPENTIGAMEEALKYPVTTLELDVVISKDMQVVVSHEPWMSAEICLNPKGGSVVDREHNLYKLAYSEIQKYDCGSKTHPRFPEQKKIATGKPLLSKLFTVIEPQLIKLNRDFISYNIEIKSLPEDEKAGFQPDVQIFSDIVVKTVKKFVPVNRFTIQSFDWRVLQYIHKTYPEIKLVALNEEKINPELDLKKLSFYPEVYSPYFKDLTPEHVKAFHAKGILVIPWTVNDKKDMKEMMRMKVDGIITDYPNLISEASTSCKEGRLFFQGQCLKIPKNASPSNDIPGWNCDPGFVQKRMKCRKIILPKNSELTNDGKSWQCKEGFKRYRGSCI